MANQYLAEAYTKARRAMAERIRYANKHGGNISAARKKQMIPPTYKASQKRQISDKVLEMRLRMMQSLNKDEIMKRSAASDDQNIMYNDSYAMYIIDAFKNRVVYWASDPMPGRKTSRYMYMAYEWLNQVIQLDGIGQVAERLEERAEVLIDAIDKIAWASNSWGAEQGRAILFDVTAQALGHELTRGEQIELSSDTDYYPSEEY